ncbi:MAG: GIY-YIG nuclease family protein [Microcoleus sp. PH2017_22_RUC_O_B]|uniref:GIY-YIG nuclease family protein n=1 Tax=unclassified Microcoleus TaxID=2642155 RepID=UPI001DFBC0CD|nr:MULTISPECIES: GIY-YIG nuclease family protein [unclassified Microcoleus]MCC3526827.1 GIY-YIG nuclease family protein [Microcoleus sp. PH2017_21_RUC_O_A]MCC3538982.1 GIY-YIG nuclease family protein [Microcoleus sp. PH2017_22_RUC_O_B]
MGWSDWYECSFDSKGEIDLRPVEKAPNWPGIYAIATKLSNGSYNVQYIGMSEKSIWKRLKAHFSGKGNRVLKRILDNKNDGGAQTEFLNALYFMYLETTKEQARGMESLFVRGTAPIANIQQNLSQSWLPRDLRDTEVEVELDDD